MLYHKFTDDVELGRAVEVEALTKLHAHFPGLTSLQYSDINAHDFNGDPGTHTRVLLVREPKFAARSFQLK